MVRERTHRLPRDCYRGEVAVAFTACVAERRPLFQDAITIHAFVELLRASAQKHGCLVMVYCFMPDHVHLILSGTGPGSDAWRAMVDFKQQTGYWLRRQTRETSWQKDFYDHIVRRDEDMAAQARYVAENPVRRGFVAHWRDYPFTGAIGVDLDAVLEGYP